MDEIARIPAEIQKIAEDIKALCDEKASVVAIKVSSDAEFEAAAGVLKLLNDQDKILSASYRQVKDPLVEEGRRVDQWFKPFLTRIADLKANIGFGMRSYQEEQNQKRLKAIREAEEKLRIERLEQQIKAQQEREKAEAARLAGNEVKAEKIEMKADRIEADAFSQVAAPVQIEVPKVAGISTRTTWKGRVVDKATFLQWAVANGYLHLIQVDDKALNQQAKSCKGEMKIPGIEWYTESTIVARGGL